MDGWMTQKSGSTGAEVSYKSPVTLVEQESSQSAERVVVPTLTKPSVSSTLVYLDDGSS